MQLILLKILTIKNEGNQQSLQKAIVQNMTMMMANKTTTNDDTLMTKIRNMGNVTTGNGVAAILVVLI